VIAIVLSAGIAIVVTRELVSNVLGTAVDTVESTELIKYKAVNSNENPVVKAKRKAKLKIAK